MLLSPSLFVIISREVVVGVGSVVVGSAVVVALVVVVLVVVASGSSWVAVVVTVEIHVCCGDCVHVYVYVVVNSLGGSACPFI